MARVPFTPPKPAALAPYFPQLEILDLIGHGGMGAVYKARQRGLDRIVALKILPPDAGLDPSFAERFQREAKALGRLNHPHIVAIYDSGQAGGLYYFLMEYVDGVNLRQAIQARTLTPPQALAIVPQICDALQYAHDQGVVHRDIKPENILLDARGQIKIADFGLARLLGQVEGTSTLTATHQVLGTPRYMAPEQMEGTHAVDHRADIYSLGVVFYELLTNELPLGRFAPPSRKVQLDVRLDEVVLRTLEKEPSLRFQQASEVKSALETISRSRPMPRHWRRTYDYEYRSRAEIFGIPLLHIAYGMDPVTHRRRVAKGVVAIGDIAIGWLAFGGVAAGVMAIGGCAFGLLTFGGCSIGLLLALGGAAVGFGFSAGGCAIGSVATGGCAVGIFAAGGGAFGVHALGGNSRDPTAQEFFTQYLHLKLAAVAFLVPLVLGTTAVIGLLIAGILHAFQGKSPRMHKSHLPGNDPLGHSRSEPRWAAGCATFALALLMSGCILSVALLFAMYLWRSQAAVQRAVAIEQRAAAAAQDRALAEALAQQQARSTRQLVLDWSSGRPVLTPGKLFPPDFHEQLQALHSSYLQLESRHLQRQVAGDTQETTIAIPDIELASLHRQLDRTVGREFRQPAERERLQETLAGPDEQGMPGIVGWGAGPTTVRISRNVIPSRLANEAPGVEPWRYQWVIERQGQSWQGSATTLPDALRRFWSDVAEQP
ncbi:MAG: serine/threonine-protein kinase [Pirellulaceae bacterium]